MDQDRLKRILEKLLRKESPDPIPLDAAKFKEYIDSGAICPQAACYNVMPLEMRKYLALGELLLSGCTSASLYVQMVVNGKPGNRIREKARELLGKNATPFLEFIGVTMSVAKIINKVGNEILPKEDAKNILHPHFEELMSGIGEHFKDIDEVYETAFPVGPEVHIGHMMGIATTLGIPLDDAALFTLEYDRCIKRLPEDYVMKSLTDEGREKVLPLYEEVKHLDCPPDNSPYPRKIGLLEVMMVQNFARHGIPPEEPKKRTLDSVKQLLKHLESTEPGRYDLTYVISAKDALENYRP